MFWGRQTCEWLCWGILVPYHLCMTNVLEIANFNYFLKDVQSCSKVQNLRFQIKIRHFPFYILGTMKSDQYLIAGNLTTGQSILAQKLLQEEDYSYAKYLKAFFPAVIWMLLLFINSPSIFSINFKFWRKFTCVSYCIRTIKNDHFIIIITLNVFTKCLVLSVHAETSDPKC